MGNWQISLGKICGRTALDASVTGYSAEATQFFSRISDPGTTRKNLYAALIDGLVTDSIWSKLDILYILAADSAGNAVINLKSSSYSLTAVNSPTFTTDRGYAGGATQYLDTNWNPSTNGVNFTLNSACIIHRGNTTGGSVSAYSMGNDTSRLHMLPDQGGGFYGRINSINAGNLTNTDRKGIFVTNRSLSNASQFYKDASSLGTDTVVSASTDNRNLYLMGSNSGSGLSLPSSDQFSLFAAGGSLSSTDVTNLKSRVDTYMTAVGA